MTTILGTFHWAGNLPDDKDVELSPEPVFSGDFGEQWQYMATEPVIQSICSALRYTNVVNDLHDPNPEDHGWYTYLRVAGWKWFLYVQWVPDGDHDKRFELEVHLCNDWWHRTIHGSRYHSWFELMEDVLSNSLAEASEIENVIFNRCAP